MTKKIAHSDLLAEIMDFLEAAQKTKTGFGIAAMADPAFVSDLENGRECLPRTIQRVRKYISENSVSQSVA